MIYVVMDMVLLALLFIRDLSMYEVKKAIEQSIGFFYKASFGSIHPALKKLEKLGYVTSKIDSKNVRQAKIYHITKSGKETMKEWLQTPIEPSPNQDEALMRFFFLNALPAKQQSQVLEDYVQKVRLRRKNLELILENGRNLPMKAKQKQGLKYRMLSGFYGLQQLDLEIQFYTKMIHKIKKGEI